MKKDDLSFLWREHQPIVLTPLHCPVDGRLSKVNEDVWRYSLDQEHSIIA